MSEPFGEPCDMSYLPYFLLLLSLLSACAAEQLPQATGTAEDAKTTTFVDQGRVVAAHKQNWLTYGRTYDEHPSSTTTATTLYWAACSKHWAWLPSMTSATKKTPRQSEAVC